jgi:hypothetical protein
MCPQDFEFDYVVVPPASADHKIIGVHGGNHWLPALRWEEVLTLAAAVRPSTTVSRARGTLLFYPGCIPEEGCEGEVKRHLREAWNECGFPVRHLDEWVDRIVSSGAQGLWRQDSAYGWIYESGSSLRNPRWIDKHHRVTPGMFSAVAQLFSTL